MRSLIAIQHYYTILLLCTLALLALVYDEGWIWPLKAAASIIPILFLTG
jgi:hypothetical protein